MTEDILEKIAASNKILIGLGEEFEEVEYLNKQSEYVDRMKWLLERDRIDLKPYLSDSYLKNDISLLQALKALKAAVDGKDYYIITTLQTGLLDELGFDQNRIVMPCASLDKKQCTDGCNESICEITSDEKREIEQALLHMKIPALGKCSKCGKDMIVNSLYAEKYCESGYLDRWNDYRTWLQGTVNKSLLILELGVNMTYPTVIRLPFEKIAFYNQKAEMFRVNEKLYQMSAELAGKGISIANNAIDWLIK